jgi:predicted PurR-regulated permease PerM
MAVTIKFTRVLFFLFLLCGGLYLAKGFLIPITFAVLLGMSLVPLCSWFEKKGLCKALSALLCVFLFLIFISGVITLLSFQVVNLTQDVDQIAAQLNKVAAKIQEYVHYKLGIPVAQQNQMMKEQGFSSIVAAKIAFAANSIMSLFAKLLLVVVYIFLFIYYRSHLEKFVLNMVSINNREKTKEILSSSSRVSQQYISGLAIMIGILWVMYGIGFSIIGVKQALFFAVLCGVLEIMPYIGNITGTFLTAVMAFSQGGGDMVFWVILVYGVVQFTQTYILEPLVLGARVSINPLCTIVIIVIGEMIWGIAGMILAIPILGVVKIICDNISSLQPFGLLIGEVKHREKESTWLYKQRHNDKTAV